MNRSRYDHGPSGGSGPGFQGPGYQGGGSGSGYQGNNGNHNGHNQHNQQHGQGGYNNQGNQQRQQQQQSGYQSNPKELSSGQYHVFTTSLCKRDQKILKPAVHAVEPATPRFLHWSEQPIVWSREDHPPWIDNPGQPALVVAPRVGGYKFTKVLMDGGSNINI